MSKSTTPRAVESVDNTELYDRWAKVYDTDGNILQSIDDDMLPSLIKQLQTLIPSGTPITITELGCGTGRNTLKLLPSVTKGPDSASMQNQLNVAQINALDLSQGMLDVARERCRGVELSNACGVDFYQFDALQPKNNSEVLGKLGGAADLVLSTLVLEHLPLDVFFSTAKQLLKKGGWLILTNMHGEMGKVSQAGFVDEISGQKVRGMSYVYSVAQVLEEAKKQGLVIHGAMRERGVNIEDVERGIVGNRGRKWIGTMVWFGCVMQLGEQ